MPDFVKAFFRLVVRVGPYVGFCIIVTKQHIVNGQKRRKGRFTELSRYEYVDDTD